MKSAHRPDATRVFVALDPPAEVCAEAEAWARHLARSTHGLRVVPARNSHVTLAFLGDRDDYEIDQIARAMVEVLEDGESRRMRAEGLSLGAPLWLPKRRPRSLTLEIHDDLGQLAELQSGLARSLQALLGWREGRPYRAHLTCGRTGRGLDTSTLRLPVSPSMSFAGESVTLYASHLSPEGAEYEALERVSLPSEDAAQ